MQYSWSEWVKGKEIFGLISYSSSLLLYAIIVSLIDIWMRNSFFPSQPMSINRNRPLCWISWFSESQQRTTIITTYSPCGIEMSKTFKECFFIQLQITHCTRSISNKIQCHARIFFLTLRLLTVFQHSLQCVSKTWTAGATKDCFTNLNKCC